MFLVLGPDELKSFFQNAITIILSMDYLHGTIYPEPFFSIGENKNGMRGTRGLLLQITAGLFVLYNEDKIALQIISIPFGGIAIPICLRMDSLEPEKL